VRKLTIETGKPGDAKKLHLNVTVSPRPTDGLGIGNIFVCSLGLVSHNYIIRENVLRQFEHLATNSARVWLRSHLEIEWDLDRRKAEAAQTSWHNGCVRSVRAEFAIAHCFAGAIIAARAARHDTGAVSLVGVFAGLLLEKGATHVAPMLPAQPRYPPLERRARAGDELDGRFMP
jgi:hypothetical protein